MAKYRAQIIYIFSILLVVASASRGLLFFFGTGHDQRWLVLILITVYLGLMAIESRVRRKHPRYINIYFLLQTIVILVLLLISVDPNQSTDYFAILFIPLCIQAIFYVPKRLNYAWVAVFTLVSLLALLLRYGLIEGGQYSLTYIFAFVFVAMLASVIVDAEQARAELQEAHQQLQEYAAQAEELAVTKERNRLARDLHDSVTQALYSLTLYAEAAWRELAAGELQIVADHLKELRQTSQQALQEMRLMIFELQPPILDEKGLAVALQERLESVEARTGIDTHIAIDIEERLPSSLEIGLYGIAREALNNILKHAQATQVHIRLFRDRDNVILEITDNGSGFDVSEAEHGTGMGIRGMRERAIQLGADLSYEVLNEGGTRLKVEVPGDRVD